MKLKLSQELGIQKQEPGNKELRTEKN